MRSKWMIAMTALAGLTAFFVQVGPAQQGKGKAAAKADAKAKASAVAPGDWPLYSRDPTSARYVPLTEINTANVSKLKQVWTWRPAALTPADEAKGKGGKGKGKGGGAGINAEVTPIVVGGVMYLPVADRVVALDADTGAEIWNVALPSVSRNRAVGYWPGDGVNPPRIIVTAGNGEPTGFLTSGAKLVALNARSGAVDPGFGKEGIVEIGLNWPGAPYIYKNLIVMGSVNGESTQGPPGDTRVYSAQTGALMWTFKTIAQPGDPNHATWLDDGWKQRAGVNTWGWYFTADEERDLVYVPLGSPAGNYWGGDRPGANLYANSIVAINATTGKYVWHFQLVHHDLWDTDLPAAPSLFTVNKDGREIPALAIISKNALMFILNRETGEPIHGVEERPVPKGSVPGEWYSPTQPFPVKPAPLARQSFSKEKDFIRAEDTTPQHVAACEQLWEAAGGYINLGPFTPFPFHEEGTPPRSALQFPGNGGPNWGGTAADPTLGYVFVATHDAALSGWVEKKREGGNYGTGNESPQPYDRGSHTGPGPYSGFSAGGFPCQRPPWGRLFAVNANTGDIAWEVVLGLNERLPEGKQLVGSVGSAGPTVTAGGLVFAPASDSRLRAFDSRTGKELWVERMSTSMNANPMSYAGRSGKQYVAGVVGGAVVVWALP